MVTLILPYDALAYLLILLMVLFSIKYLKTNMMFLFVYYPLRPIMSEINQGLTFLGDAVLISALVITLFYKKSDIYSLSRKQSYFIYYLLFLMIGSISALIISNVSIISLAVELRALGLMLIFVFIFSNNYWVKRDYILLLNTTFVTALVISVHGILEKLLGKSVMLPQSWAAWDLSKENAERVYGTLGNPNVLAMYLLFVFVLTFLPFVKESRLKFMVPIVQIATLSTVLLTASRGSLLAFFIAGFIYLIITKKWTYFLKVALLTVLSFILIYYPAQSLADAFDQKDDRDKTEQREKKSKKDSLDLFERLQVMFSDRTIKASTNWGRIYILIKGKEIFLDHPIIGTGFATFGDSATQSFSSPIYETYNIKGDIYTDNQYIHILVSTGLVGLILLMIFLIRLLRMIWTQYLFEDKWFFIFLTITFLISCLYYNTLESKTFMMLYFTLLGILFNRSRGVDHA
ncbi:O-antigen ligase family protein [Piscibacillus salipiscarius]|uniref:O-antigen ligase family protein n=2 Tax=Piscibacillus salipiscarius TaxID=299480 RepID=A0ABW5QBM9_9BACI